MRKEDLAPVLTAIIVAFVLQCSLVRHIQIGVSRPDLVGVVAIVVGLVWGPYSGLTAGLLGGLLGDVYNGRFIGLLLLTRGAAGLAAGAATRRVFKENLLMTGVVCFVLSFASDLLGGAILVMNGISLSPTHYLPMIGISGVLNMVVTPFVFIHLWKQKVRIDSRNSAVLVE